VATNVSDEPQKTSGSFHMLHTGFLLGLFFDLEDAGVGFLRTVGPLLTYTIWHYIPEDKALHNHGREINMPYLISLLHPRLRYATEE
jgi:hypothetical protein